MLTAQPATGGMRQTEGSTTGTLNHLPHHGVKGKGLWPILLVASSSSLQGHQAIIWPPAALPTVAPADTSHIHHSCGPCGDQRVAPKGSPSASLTATCTDLQRSCEGQLESCGWTMASRAVVLGVGSPRHLGIS